MGQCALQKFRSGEIMAELFSKLGDLFGASPGHLVDQLEKAVQADRANPPPELPEPGVAAR